eukprot:PhM_4_TR5665/c0_g1_i1/m.69759/K01800/maiA, GSTZ1; maleylacetoacetate isomerase
MSSPKRAKTEADTYTLYSYWRSSCSWRVRAALKHKSIPFEYKPINLLKKEQKSPEYVALNPMGVVPALVTPSGVVLTQSLAIMEYLEEVHTASGLLPAAPEQRAATRMVCNVISSGIQPIQNLGVLAKVGADFGEEHKMPWGKHWISVGFEALEKILEQTAGEYCVGDSFTMADVCLVPQVYNANRFAVDIDKFPVIKRVHANAAAHPSMAETHPDKMPDATQA